MRNEDPEEIARFIADVARGVREDREAEARREANPAYVIAGRLIGCTHGPDPWDCFVLGRGVRCGICKRWKGTASPAALP